ncbi:MAG: group II intron reverse transcriptase/maturase [Psychroflexus sp.]
MNLTTPEKVRKLQETLNAKAKESPGYRFYVLYDKIYREDVLWYAYRLCRANGGAAGVDGMTFAEVERYGRERWLGELAEMLRNKQYRADAIRRVYIPKPNGKERPLGIPTIKDRVVQTAAVLVLEPIFEADLQPEQYAYRPDRSAHDAIRAVHALVNTGHTEVIDADLSSYYDTIPHAELMKSLARRISDGKMLKLIKMWLKAPVEETDERGRRQRRTLGKDKGRGIPQGAPISPLLANLYMRRFILGWKKLGFQQRWRAYIVNYADDYVICCQGNAREAMAAMLSMMEKIKLTINETKTGIRVLPGDRLKFLGYTIGLCYSPKTGRAYIGTTPSKESVRRICRVASEATGRRWLCQAPRERAAYLNRKLVGWANYFCLGPVSKAYRNVDAHVRNRLRQWLCEKHKVPTRGTSRFPDEYLYERLGLVRLTERTRNFPWAKA